MMNVWVILFILVGLIVLVAIPLVMQRRHMRDTMRQDFEESPTMPLPVAKNAILSQDEKPVFTTRTPTRPFSHTSQPNLPPLLTTKTPTSPLIKPQQETLSSFMSKYPGGTYPHTPQKEDYLPFTTKTPSGSFAQSPLRNSRTASHSSGEQPILETLRNTDSVAFSNSGIHSLQSSTLPSGGSIPRGMSLSGSFPLSQFGSSVNARIFEDGIQVKYDLDLDAINLIFLNCPLHTTDEVALAFRILHSKVEALHGQLMKQQSAFLVDISGLEVNKEVLPIWRKSLKTFLSRVCLKTNTGHFLVTRYHSRLPTSASSQQEILQRIRYLTSTNPQGAQNNTLDSREEAVALLRHLQRLTTN